MATYNGAAYIREQIDSVLNQTLQDFEIVICDDCSNDKTLSILRQYEEKDERIHVYKNSNNVGFLKNFENVIKKCRGEYVALCDQDDIWLPDHLEILMNAITPSVQIVCGKPIFVDENLNKLPEYYDYFLMYAPPFDNMSTARHIFMGKSTYQGASMLIRASFFNHALPIPEGANYHDNWFAILACFLDGFVFVNKPTMLYRRYCRSVTFQDRRVSAIRRFLAMIIHNQIPEDRKVFIKCLRERLDQIDPVQKSFLNEIEKKIRLEESLVGRILNIPYKINHFKAIYACDLKHLFS